MSGFLKHRWRAAFTLVEMAIVLGIASVILGGTITANNVLKTAQNQSVAQEMSDIQRAYKDYHNQYGSMPGDSNNASILFNCGGCDGDGDGQIDLAPVEYLLFWQHLSSAKLIKGSYSIFATELGKLYPESEVASGAAYTVTKRSPGRTVLQICPFGNPTGLGALSPIQAQLVDKALDDGKPTSGRIVVEPGNGVSISQCITAGEYNTSVTARQCNLLYTIQGSVFTNYQVTGNGVASCGTLDAPTISEFTWRADDWSNCSGCAWAETSRSDSGTCGTITRSLTFNCPAACGTTQTRTVSCVNIQTGAVVPDASCAGMTKPAVSQSCTGICPQPPPATTQSVTLGSCTTYDWQINGVGAADDGTWVDGSCTGGSATWNTGSWSACSEVTCNVSGTQSRTVNCATTAGTMTQTRTVVCKDNTGTTVADGLCTTVKPASSQSVSCTPSCSGATPANSQACVGPCSWVTGSWGACTTAAAWNIGTWGACTGGTSSCGASGTQTRTVTCTPASGTQTRGVTCPGTCPGAAPSTTQSCCADASCSATTCPSPTPDASQVCIMGTPIEIFGQTAQSIYQTYTSGASWLGCIKPD